MTGNNQKTTKSIGVRMSEEEYEKLKGLAFWDNRTVSNYIRLLINRQYELAEGGKK